MLPAEISQSISLGIFLLINIGAVYLDFTENWTQEHVVIIAILFSSHKCLKSIEDKPVLWHVT